MLPFFFTGFDLNTYANFKNNTHSLFFLATESVFFLLLIYQRLFQEMHSRENSFFLLQAETTSFECQQLEFQRLFAIRD